MSVNVTRKLLFERHVPRASRTHPSVSVVVPTLNGGELLLQLLTTIQEQEVAGEVEVLIGDSESNDGSIEAAIREHPSVRVFTVSRARFDHGLVRTALIQRARAEKVALFSQDAVPLSSQYLQKMANVLDDKSIAGVYARQQPRPGADPLVCEMLERWTPSAIDSQATVPILKQLTDGVQLEDLEPLERMKMARFDNVASMVQAALFDRMPFPSRAFGEDIAWGALVLAAGLKLAYLPTAGVAHHHAPRLRSTFERNRVAHRQARGEFGLHAVPGLSHLARALISGIPHDLRAGPVWALRGVPRRGAALLGQWAGAREACRESNNES